MQDATLVDLYNYYGRIMLSLPEALYFCHGMFSFKKTMLFIESYKYEINLVNSIEQYIT